jgi:putative transposase
MDDKYLLVAARYVELNPVRAGLAHSAGDYEWSSASAHLRGEDDILVRFSPLSEMVDNWNDFLQQGLEEKELELLRRHSSTGRPLGDEGFVRRLERRLSRLLRLGRPGPKPEQTR